MPISNAELSMFMRKVYFRLLTGPVGIEASNTILFLDCINFLRNKGVEPVLVFTIKLHNQTLNMLIKRKIEDLGIRVIDISWSKLLTALYHRIILRKNIVRKEDIEKFLEHEINRKAKFINFCFSSADFERISRAKIFLSFSEAETKRGLDELNKIGVTKDFVCVHARDPIFYEHIDPQSRSQPENLFCIRNISFSAYLPACRYLEKHNIQTLRMGAMQCMLDESIFNENIIDYAGRHRTDFMDIWNIAECKFFLGSNSGLYMVPYLFNKPVALANMSNILSSAPFKEKDIYIPQNIWHKKEKRFLTYKEISANEIGLYWTAEKYKQEGLECVSSSPEEILELTEEMNDVIDGKYHYSEDDNYLQEQFRNAFRIHQWPHITPARVGKEFLKRNMELIS